jgi:hypothetical protein
MGCGPPKRQGCVEIIHIQVGLEITLYCSERISPKSIGEQRYRKTMCGRDGPYLTEVSEASRQSDDSTAVETECMYVEWVLRCMPF